MLRILKKVSPTRAKPADADEPQSALESLLVVATAAAPTAAAAWGTIRGKLQDKLTNAAQSIPEPSQSRSPAMAPPKNSPR